MREQRLMAKTGSESARDAELQQIVNSAARFTGLSFAAITIMGAERQWFAARIELEAEELIRLRSFCAQAIPRHEPMMVWDARADARFSLDPLVLAEASIRFYAAVPLFDEAGYRVATLSVAGAQPRTNFPHIHELVRLAHRAERFVCSDCS